jgi:anti-anti-sigma regulatory factor
MRFTIEQLQAAVPVTILALHGDLDATNFEEVIGRARDLYAAGTRYLLLDLGDVPFMGSSGLVALHSIALIMRGEEPPDPEFGWQAFHDIDHARNSGLQRQVKLLNPQPGVDRTLALTGLKDYFGTYTDRKTAIDSF